MAIREEILVGLKNAIARGESLEKAVRSMINSGYNSAEIQQAADSIKNNSMGVTGLMHNPESEETEASQIETRRERESASSSGLTAPASPAEPGDEQKKRKRKILIMLGVLFILLAAMLLLFIFQGQAILEAIFG